MQTIGLQECMVKNKEYYKDFIGSSDSAEGKLLHSSGSKKTDLAHFPCLREI